MHTRPVALEGGEGVDKKGLEALCGEQGCQLLVSASKHARQPVGRGTADGSPQVVLVAKRVANVTILDLEATRSKHQLVCACARVWVCVCVCVCACVRRGSQMSQYLTWKPMRLSSLRPSINAAS